MIPPLIVEEALQRGIQLIAITDHNATANIAAVQKAARQLGASGTRLVVLPGMELQTREEVHVLCLFDHARPGSRAASLGRRASARRCRTTPISLASSSWSMRPAILSAGKSGCCCTSVDVHLARGLANRCTSWAGCSSRRTSTAQPMGCWRCWAWCQLIFPIEALEISRHITPDEAPKTLPADQRVSADPERRRAFPGDFLGSTEWQLDRWRSENCARPSGAKMRQGFVSNP